LKESKKNGKNMGKKEVSIKKEIRFLKIRMNLKSSLRKFP